MARPRRSPPPRDPTVRVVPPTPRPPGRRGQRLEARLQAAIGNVRVALAGAEQRGPLPVPLRQATQDWTTEAERVGRDLRVTHELTGDARDLAMRRLTTRVGDLERVADRLVDAAFLSTLLPATPADDPLHHAAERIDALEEAYRELVALERPLDAPVTPAGERWRVRVPTRRRRSAS